MNCLCSHRDDSYPLRSAETGSFRKGAPRSFAISAAGHRAAFLRSESGRASALDLWVIDQLDKAPVERLVLRAVDCGIDESNLTAEERARRERLRESGGGITAFSTDELMNTACFALGAALWVCDLNNGAARRIGEYSAVVDPRLNSRGDCVAFTEGRDFVVYSLATERELLRLAAETEHVTYGLADFIAAEELSRHRGHWWEPSGNRLLVERNDESAVAVRWLADPTYPDAEPRAHRYPAAGTTNSEVRLFLVELVSDSDAPQQQLPPIELQWDREQYEYVADVVWGESGPLITLMSRNQQLAVTYTLEGSALVEVVRVEDAAWVDAGVGAPCLVAGDLIQFVDKGQRYLQWGSQLVDLPVSSVHSVVSAAPDQVIVSAYAQPWQLQIWSVSRDRTARLLSDSDGYAQAVAAGPYTVIIQQRPNLTQPEFRLLRDGRLIHHIANLAESAELVPLLNFELVSEQELPTMVIWPGGHQPGSHKLPVIVHIYGGPHHSEVMASGWRHSTKQWLANQGYAVITIDNRGNPGKGPAWERSVRGNLAQPVIEDQVAALQALFDIYPDDLDRSRVGITGWSFGGYLSALALLARPDVYKAGWAGAPVTDWRLYDTAYTERYLGHPAEEPHNYEQSSLIPLAKGLQGALCLVHGLADDNVLAAHSLQLSGALLAAGKPHRFLPLAGVSHMTPQVDVAKNLLLLMRDFFDDELR